MVYNVEKMLKDHRDKIGEEEATKVDAALKEAKDAMAGGSVETINKAVENLTNASHKLAEAMYKSSSTEAGAGPTPDSASAGTGEPKKDDVVDAEFVDVDEKKNS
jgi:molecular chaperone DnaK